LAGKGVLVKGTEGNKNTCYVLGKDKYGEEKGEKQTKWAEPTFFLADSALIVFAYFLI
jgi:hypothetical protein